ncbi:MAG: DUF2334 domain-containing protein [Gammaproteobacteria bacterium]|nr:DUF2334 domain-containing protein [Gammaproteobacteria bacterium]
MRSKVTFRMDDITPGMSWEKFDLLVELFNKHHIKPLLGIVPDNQDASLNIDPPRDNFWERMRDLKKQGWLIAQHGYQHTYLTTNGGILEVNQKSEFAGLSFDEQYQRILKGKEILQQQDLATSIWMAPGHSYDLMTLKALKQLEFACVTDGYSLKPYRCSGLKFIPCQMSLPCLIPFALVTVCIHSNTASSACIQKLDSFLSTNPTNCVDFSEAIAWPSGGALNRGFEKIALGLRKLKTFRF